MARKNQASTEDEASVAKQWHPYASSKSNYSEDLWRWLDKTAAEKGEGFS